MEALVERLEKAVVRLEAVAGKLQFGPGGMANGDITCHMINGGESQSMEAFDLLLSGSVCEYVKTSRAIGGDVAKHAEMVNNALQIQRSFLQMSMTHREPVKTELADLLRPLSDQIHEVQSFREKNRGSDLFNHLSAVSESIPALGWVAVGQKPGPYVKEMNDAAMFYTNRVLKDYKDTDGRHIEWVRSYLSIWTELQSYIKEHHTTGLVWSKTGPVAPSSQFSAPSDGPPPPPPPPPPPLPPVFTDNKPSDAAAQHLALFAQLNQGQDITKGLKHVSDEQKTHKNASLRCAGIRVQQECPARSQTQRHTPVLELEGKKWRVEHQDQSHDLLIAETELRQVVYVFSCNRSTLQIRGKVNSIIVDNCKKLGLVFDSAVGIVEIINSSDVQLQVTGKVPTISINKTEGCHVYLSRDSLDCEIVSAKSSEMNILVPEGEDDYREFPVPEQFKTVWDGSGLVTEPTKIAG
ncbi:adenylyl cyclase-associated protein 2 [Pimephales promelas]|uniref:adenylyl cyclase-associated protein 2 n=1 Tax=Pimephales promelas TaxID=90988 RepID=UPI0019557507|nr:adenylyl cyclase-associated protein 2 [Pimephales promelas]XP_039536422.1 adenylyl cyclase-associated protein 2 [Pimephales promelas]KAG1946843.1 adenylyl cyclase-associated protein 1 isoform a [Pimephales promelas]KAG1946844.1 adenylyl cyclase-associated protein 1 isoform a [Pimephales promelas]KAG1946845.1 adenylyl cyclase-associated protein 1 isoform a [Pimephales promelas]